MSGGLGLPPGLFGLPPGPFEINPTWRQSMISCLTGFDPADASRIRPVTNLVTGEAYRLPSAATVGGTMADATEFGPGARIKENTSPYWLSSGWGRSGISGDPATIMWFGKMISHPNVQYDSLYSIRGTNRSTSLNFYSNAIYYAHRVRSDAYAEIIMSPFDLSTQAGDVFVAIGTTRSQTDHELHVRRFTREILWRSDTSTTNCGVSNTTSVYETLHSDGPQSASPLNLPTDGVLYFAAFWDRGMSSAEMAGLAQNPWDLVRPVQTRFAAVGGGGGGAGSYIFVPRPKLITSGFWAA